MYQLRTLFSALAATLILGNCVYVPMDYYPRPYAPNRYLEDPYYDYAPRSHPPDRYRNWDDDRDYDRRPRRYERGRQLNRDHRTGDTATPSIPLEDESDVRQKPDKSSRSAASPPPPPVELPPAKKEANDNSQAPVATRSTNPGRVKSPFPPYNELDVGGLQPGSLAKDPSNGKVFRVP